MDVGQRRMDSIAANLANVTTPAFKRLSTSTQAFKVSRGGHDVSGVRLRQQVDFTQGILERTSAPTDVALVGDGFFVVDSRAGELYTRNGSFRLDEEGTLMTHEGYPVAWEGARGRIDSVGAEIVIDPTGTVRQGSNTVGKLKLVSFDDPTQLNIDRRGYFVAPPEMPRNESTAEVHQGALERSNVSAVDELVSMIQVQRNFEVASNLMRSIDQTYRRLVQQRG